MASGTKARVIIPEPKQVRCLQNAAGYGWLDARLLRDAWFPMLSAEEIAVYVFLCLVADRSGVSWYRRDRIRTALGLGEQSVWQALSRLEAIGLVAYRPFHEHASEGFRQVLAIPGTGPGDVVLLDKALTP